MDKKQRSEIVAVKLGEVVREENDKVKAENDAQLEKYKDLPEIAELRKMKEQYNKMRKALETYENEIEKKAKLVETMDLPVKPDVSFSYRSDCSMKIHLKEEKETFGTWTFGPNDIVTSVMRHRNSKNDRIKKVALEGYELVVEDKDDEQLRAFLEL